MMRQSLFCFLLLFFFFEHQAFSSSSSSSPSTNSNKKISDNDLKSSIDEKSRLQSPSAVTFLYELYEHEIYNPSTERWTSRRFTQSPISGGGGRDSTSLDPQSCTPPRNYLFSGEWKIDMAGETRDGFGWEYYAGKYDGLGRRRRRWVRELRRISSSSSSSSSVLIDKTTDKRKKSIQQQKARTKAQIARSRDRNMFQTLQKQYNFKGFGWSFYKSLLFMRSFGAAIRLPLSSNLDFYDQHAAWPYISTSTYFGYPWVVATFLNASLPVEAIKYIIGGVVWKLQWSMAVFSALSRSVVEALVWMILSPWRLIVGAMQTITELTGRADNEKQDKKIMDSLITIIRDENKESNNESIDNGDIQMESFIELSNSTDVNSETDMMSVSANALKKSPRGGASQADANEAPRMKRLTLFGNEVPSFHRPYSIEYSTIQKRVGICVSWRVSKERGYEYRCNFFLTCLPTIVFWQQLQEERNRRLREMQQFRAKIFGSDVTKKKAVSASNKSISKRSSKNSVLSSFFCDHSSTLGFSSGWPLPFDPFFSFNLMLSLSGFYYGWLLNFISSLFSVRKSPGSSKSNKKSSTAATKADKNEIIGEDSVTEFGDVVSSIETKSEVSDFGEKGKRPVECK